ncbi:MAG: DUF2336 domain-containing protein [Dongiaceae bacterium]
MGDARFDLLQLADIARDRSAQGRAKLFALLADLLCDRWRDLTARERDLFAELLQALSPLAEEADCERLGRSLAAKPDLPESLSRFAAPAEPLVSALCEPTSIHRMADEVLRAEPDAIEETVSLDGTQPVDEPELADPGIASGDRPSPDTPLSGAFSPPQPKPAVTLPTVSARVTLPPQQRVTVVVSRPVRISRATSGPTPPPIQAETPVDPPLALPTLPPISPVPLPDRFPNPFPPGGAYPMPAMPEPAEVTPDPVSDPVLSVPRDNPHRLTPNLLGQALDQGDLPRFEVMLAHLSGLRAPLLRRLLRDGGSEGFAIVARAAGFDAEGFVAQWQDWRRQQAELGRATLRSGSLDEKQIGAFFAALTDQQIDRLIQRWRSDGDRLFAAPRTSEAERLS